MSSFALTTIGVDVTKRAFIDVNNEGYTPKNQDYPRFFYGQKSVLGVYFRYGSTTAVSDWAAGDTFSLAIDPDYNHTDYDGTLDDAKTGAITDIDITFAVTPTLDDTGHIILVNDEGDSESVAYTAQSGTGTGPYTFTVSKTLDYSYASGDIASVADKLMVDDDNDNVDIVGTWTEIDRDTGKVSFLVDSRRYEFLRKLEALAVAAGDRTETVKEYAVKIEIKRVPSGETIPTTVLSDICYAARNVKWLESSDAPTDGNFTQTDARYIKRGDATVVEPTELTIATGSITRTQLMHTVDTEGDAGADDLDTIAGASAGDLVWLYPANAARTVTLKSGTGNIVTSTAADIVMQDNAHYLGYYDGSNWRFNEVVVTGALIYKGTWDADTNTPTLADGTGNVGDTYIVSVAGTTSLDGIADWEIGDWAVFNGTVWQKIDNSESGKVKMDSADTIDYLDQKVDDTTIESNGSKKLAVKNSSIGRDQTTRGTADWDRVTALGSATALADNATENITLGAVATYRAFKVHGHIKATSAADYMQFEVMVLHDGTNANVNSVLLLQPAAGNSLDGPVTFSADIDSGNLRLGVTLTSLGDTASLKYRIKDALEV